MQQQQQMAKNSSREIVKVDLKSLLDWNFDPIRKLFDCCRFPLSAEKCKKKKKQRAEAMVKDAKRGKTIERYIKYIVMSAVRKLIDDDSSRSRSRCRRRCRHRCGNNQAGVNFFLFLCLGAAIDCTLFAACRTYRKWPS